MGTAEEMAFRVRSSKFRHVYGSPSKKELCYECIKITKNAHDSNFCAVNPKFVAIVTESAGGGSFLIINLEKTGRVDINASKVCGHAGPVLDIKWNPFNDHVIASCSDDATVKIWQVPEGGLKGNLTEWLVDLHGHQRRVGFLEWHPTAENILLSAGYDFKVILWNVETAEPINIITCHTDTIFSISWNRDGSLFATTSKDKKIRVIEAREGKVIQEGAGHQGTKASKVVFLGDLERLFTTGFSRMSERQYGVWDAKNLSKPLRMEQIDSSSGVLFPYYDHDTKIAFVAGKGDGNIRYYEIVDDAPYIHFLSQYQSGSPQRGLGMMPKRGVDPMKCEIVRFYKLHAVKGICEPVSMIVPRKSEMFQDDIFPPTSSSTPSLTGAEWLSGQNREPILISLKDGVVSQAPTITTYKAVKRTSTGPSNSPDTTRSSKRTNSSSSIASSGTGSGTATPPEKLPASLRNIRKLSSAKEEDFKTFTKSVSEDQDTADTMTDRISAFEDQPNVSKRTINITNASSPVRVDKKVWSSSSTPSPVRAETVTNGVPGTDPEFTTSPTSASPRSSSSSHLSRKLTDSVTPPDSPFLTPTDGPTPAENSSKFTSSIQWTERSVTSSKTAIGNGESGDINHNGDVLDKNSPEQNTPKQNLLAFQRTSLRSSSGRWKGKAASDSHVHKNTRSRSEQEQNGTLSSNQITESTPKSSTNHKEDISTTEETETFSNLRPSVVRRSKRWNQRPTMSNSFASGTNENPSSRSQALSSTVSNVESPSPAYYTPTATTEENVFFPEKLPNPEDQDIKDSKPSSPRTCRENVQSPIMFDNVVLESVDNTLIRPSKLRESLRRAKTTGKPVHQTSEGISQEEEPDDKITVKKVWSPQPPPASDIPRQNGIPSTDPELRKAYFRQLEEIKSLKEQISMKDKRIRQLEEELRSAREGTGATDPSESCC